MKKLLFILFFLVLGSSNAYSQDLLGESIRKVTNRKKSIYLDSGIFHNGKVENKAVLKAVRHFFNSKTGFERIVFDFEGKEIPRIYGHMAGKDKKIFIDFFSTDLNKNLNSFGSSRFVKSLDIYPIGKETVSFELSMKEKFTADVFYLENPGRLVIDVKN